MEEISIVDRNEKNGRWISDTLTVASLTVFSYLVAFLYHSSYLKAFEAPVQIISLNLTTVLLAAGGILFTFIFLFHLANLFVILLPDNLEHPIWAALLNVAPFLLVFIILLLNFGLMWKEWVVSLMIVFIYVGLEFIPPLFGPRTQTYIERMRSLQVKERNTKGVLNFLLPTNKLNKNTAVNIIKAIIIILIIIFLAYVGGRSHAIKQESFMVFTDGSTAQDMAVISIFDNQAIAVPIDKEKGTYKKEFVFIDLNSEGVRFKIEKIGRLVTNE